MLKKHQNKKNKMKEFRCYKCRNLLYKADGEVDVEIICRKCRTINYPLRLNDGVGPRGMDFQIGSIDHRCDRCGKILFKSRGVGKLESVCTGCKKIVSFDTELMRAKNYETTTFCTKNER